MPGMRLLRCLPLLIGLPILCGVGFLSCSRFYAVCLLTRSRMSISLLLMVALWNRVIRIAALLLGQWLGSPPVLFRPLVVLLEMLRQQSTLLSLLLLWWLGMLRRVRIWSHFGFWPITMNWFAGVCLRFKFLCGLARNFCGMLGDECLVRNFFMCLGSLLMTNICIYLSLLCGGNWTSLWTRQLVLVQLLLLIPVKNGVMLSVLGGIRRWRSCSSSELPLRICILCFCRADVPNFLLRGGVKTVSSCATGSPKPPGGWTNVKCAEQELILLRGMDPEQYQGQAKEWKSMKITVFEKHVVRINISAAFVITTLLATKTCPGPQKSKAKTVNPRRV